MSMISHQVEELREFKKILNGRGFKADILAEAADTIESLSTKLAAANMERSEHISGDCIDRQELICELSEIFQDDATNGRFNYVLELADMYAQHECNRHTGADSMR